MTKEFSDTIKEICDNASHTRNMTPQTASSLSNHAYTTIAFALLRGNAAMAKKLVAIIPPRDISPQLHTYRYNVT